MLRRNVLSCAGRVGALNYNNSDFPDWTWMLIRTRTHMHTYNIDKRRTQSTNSQLQLTKLNRRSVFLRLRRVLLERIQNIESIYFLLVVSINRASSSHSTFRVIYTRTHTQLTETRCKGVAGHYQCFWWSTAITISPFFNAPNSFK